MDRQQAEQRHIRGSEGRVAEPRRAIRRQTHTGERAFSVAGLQIPFKQVSEQLSVRAINGLNFTDQSLAFGIKCQKAPANLTRNVTRNGLGMSS
jgi:hypothetical protein